MSFGDAETERLRLERWAPARHADGFAAMNAEAEVMEFLGGGEATPREDSDHASDRIAAHWDTYGFGLWALIERQAGEMVGFGGLCRPLWFPAMAESVEVGWRLRREAWGRGYATESARYALRAGFEELGLDEILAFVHPDNERSIAVARRLGMTERETMRHPSRPHELTVFTIRR